MPEFPDVTVYVESLQRRLSGHTLKSVRVLNPFVLRTAVPPLAAAHGRKVTGVRRIGKRVAIALEGELFIVIHLMIAGRLRWLEKGAKPPGRIGLAQFEFEHGSLALTEAGTKRRASIHLVQGEEALAAMNPGGLEVLETDAASFAAKLRSENHTLKRALTDPRLFSGIRFGEPCPACGAPVQRIVYARGKDNYGEANYCARCQTGGRILADRALSRLLKKSWPKSIDELE